ncbi:MAG: serine protease [Alteromonas sp.]|uniref:S8 family serine peptidase n=1 Tax=unclassified Alteromonas TaxID=2614992 RepID=UPI00090368AB|nr:MULTISPECIES: S8 family serine peptidase [unclassified Alteromonas]APE05144.1 serine protease [Alteromonas sp. RW2A1]AUC88188.1 serine protease [Alteromonas sp. MB-3u-76]MAI65084.1 serine protease [Alteromonas sp.]
MNKNVFKLSGISAIVALTLAGCGGSGNSDSSSTEIVDSAPSAQSIVIAEALQWIPSQVELLGADPDGDPISYSIMENGEQIEPVEGVYTLSHGQVTIEREMLTYTSFSGEPASFEYVVFAKGKSASATVSVQSVINDPLAVQQWHLRNTGQKAYALSDEMKQGWFDYLISLGFSEEGAKANVEAQSEPGEAALVAGEDINVVGAFAKGVTGKGVTAVVVDSGLELRHEDLSPNVVPNRSLNLETEGVLDRTDPTSQSTTGDHGTSVAGLIAAKGWNGKGGRGVSPDTGLIGMDYIGQPSPLVPQAELLVHGFPGSGISVDEEVSTFNRSYGRSIPSFIGYSFLNEAIESYPNRILRSGKGAVNVKSNGNSFGDGGGFDGSLCQDNGAIALGLTCLNGNFDSTQGHPYYFSVAAVNSDGKHTSYSTAGANTLVAAPAGEFGRWFPAMVTTDQATCINGYSGFNGSSISIFSNAGGEEFAQSQFPFNYPGHPDNAGCNYTSTFNGTSSAAPNASGVISLILSANPSLTWRDVRHILASTSTVNDPENSPVVIEMGEEDVFVAHDGWVENGAGFNFNNLYGFGRVDAGLAVSMALAYEENLGEEVITDWTGLGTAIGVEETPVNSAIPDNNAQGLTVEVEMTDDVVIEAMQFSFDVFNQDMGFGFVTTDELGTRSVQTSAGMDLAIEVISPSGTRSVLLSSKQSLFLPALSSDFAFLPEYILNDSVFLSNAFYGESAKGTWTIRLIDTGNTSFNFSDGGNNFFGVSGIANNTADSVLEGLSMRAFGHVEQ